VNTWIANPGDLRGPEGLAGADGDPGTAGAKGDKGDQGDQGIQGPAGDSDLGDRFTDGHATGSSSGGGACQGDKVIGEVWQFAGNFAPIGSASAEGQLLAISTNQSLFSIVGTIYGGDGRTTFGLPDLRGLAPEGVTYVICLGGLFPTRN
jgi:hypothetical protein